MSKHMEPGAWQIVAAVISSVTLVVTALIGLIVRGTIQTLKEMRDDHKRVVENVAAVRELIAGDFLPRTEAAEERGRADQRFMAIENRLLLLERGK